MKQPHKIQIAILKKLLFSDSLSYTEMKPDPEMGNNQYDFHLKTLIKQDLIGKISSKYQLTQKGKEYANRIDTDRDKINLQAKLSIWLCCIRETSSGASEFLIGTRQKQPFFGKQGFMAGKIRLGESIVEAAKRELKEESNLEGEPKLVMIRHYLVFDKLTRKLLEDKFMFLCKIGNPVGEMESNDEVELGWVPKKELREFITDPFESIDHIVEIVEIAEGFDGNVRFEEFEEFTEEF